MSKEKLKRTTGAIMQNKPVRVMMLLTFLFIAINISLIIISVSYRNRSSEMDIEIEKVQAELKNIQKTVTEEVEPLDEENGKRTFAPYEEIVPFISLLENLFGLIDPEAQITIRNEESQILANRYADYEIKLNARNKEKLLFKALDELYKSKYVTRVVNSNIDYKLSPDTEINDLENASFVVRLYFE